MNIVELTRQRQLAPQARGVPCCRVCGAVLHRSFVDLGATPHAHRFVTPAQAALGIDRAWNLHVRVCEVCLLVQLDTAAPDETAASGEARMFAASPDAVEQARGYAGTVIGRFGLGPHSLVVEVASEAGERLLPFLGAGIPVLGIEPEAGAAAMARRRGVPTETAFFGAAAARILAGRGVSADLLLAHNVLPLVPDVAGFIAGVGQVLAPHGVVSLEFPHLLRLIEGVQFDAIHHAHHSYFTLTAAERLLRRAELRVFDAEQLATEGGRLRLHVCHAAAAFPEQPTLAQVRAAERAARLDRPEGYDGFAPRVAEVQRSFREFLARERWAGRRVAGFGAATQASTLLNSSGVTAAELPFIADHSPAKQHRLVPGCRIPILPPEALHREAPENVVILPWMIADQIARDLDRLRRDGTRLWVAIPELRPV